MRSSSKPVDLNRPSQESGRACGCDPRAGHACSQHAAHIDESTVEIRAVEGFVAITGPTSRGVFELHVDDAGSLATIELGRFAAEDLVYELAKRLAARE